jgi:uncharacterized protein with HEPN domain
LPFRDPWLSFQEILEAIGQIDQFVEGMELESFRADPKTVAAVERKLLVISEAAIRLGEQAGVLCPGPAWRDIRGIGNWLRHQYDAVDVETIWLTITRDLALLKKAVNGAMARRVPQ